MARLLSGNEADCLIAQHRKPGGFPLKNHHVQTECIPRERFSPSTSSGRLPTIGACARKFRDAHSRVACAKMRPLMSVAPDFGPRVKVGQRVAEDAAKSTRPVVAFGHRSRANLSQRKSVKHGPCVASLNFMSLCDSFHSISL